MKKELKWSSRAVLPRSGNGNEWLLLPQQELAEMYFTGRTQEEMVKRFGPIARDVFSPDIFRSRENLLSNYDGLGQSLRSLLDVPAMEVMRRLYYYDSPNGSKSRANPFLCLAALHNLWQRRESLFLQVDPDTGRTLFQDLVLTRPHPAGFLLLFRPDEWERYGGDEALLVCEPGRRRFEELIETFSRYSYWGEANKIGSSYAGLWRIIRGVASDRRGVPLLRNGNSRWHVTTNLLILINNLPRIDFAGATADDLLFSIPGTRRYPYPVRPLDIMVGELSSRKLAAEATREREYLLQAISRYIPLMRSLVECEWADKVFMEPVSFPPTFQPPVSRTLVGALVELVATVSCEAEKRHITLDSKSRIPEVDTLLTGILRRGGVPTVAEAASVLEKTVSNRGFIKRFPLTTEFIEMVKWGGQVDPEQRPYDDPDPGETCRLDERGV